MVIELPRGIEVDIDNIPDDLYETVQREFEKYTEFTNPMYMYHDKLLFIDVMLEKLHHADADDKVNQFIKDRFAYQLDEYGEIADESEFLSVDFMVDCYELGRKDCRLYSHDFGGKYKRDNNNVMKIEMIVIKAVMDYEGGNDNGTN